MLLPESFATLFTFYLVVKFWLNRRAIKHSKETKRMHS